MVSEIVRVSIISKDRYEEEINDNIYVGRITLCPLFARLCYNFD